MQALQLGLMMLGVDVHTDRFAREQKLSWDQGNGLGLIVPASMRDRLFGDVSTFYGDD